jgi:hypothetical protein
VDPGERVKLGLSQALIKGTRPNSNSRPTIFFKIVLQGKVFRYVSISLIEEPCKSSNLAALDMLRTRRHDDEGWK